MFLWRAYQEIRRDRPVGFGVSAIPTSAITSWCDAQGIECVIQRERIKQAVFAMDEVDRSIAKG